MDQPPRWRGWRGRPALTLVAIVALVLGAAVGCGPTAGGPQPSLALRETATRILRGTPPGSTLAVVPSAVAAGVPPAPTASATAAVSSAPAPRPLLELTGRGFRTSQRFRTRAAWTITYRFDCTRYGAEGNFQVVVYAGGQLVEVAINDVAWSGRGHAFERQTAAETYLQINSECDWQVVVQS